MHYPEESLIIELRKNNQLALKQLYKANYPMILTLVVNNNGTEEEAKDIYQEAIIHFYERLQHAEFVLTCKSKTYLYAVCRKLWLQKLAQRNKFVKIDEVDPVAGVDDVVQELEAKEKRFQDVETSLKKLGEPCKSILEDYYLKSLTMDQITEKFGYTNADNAKNQKYKCLQRLKKLFFEEHAR
jgi:RNA polymerase sigma factor (sigma-70 family)